MLNTEDSVTAEEDRVRAIAADERTPVAEHAPEGSGGLTWIPFALYLGAWVVLATGSAYLLRGATVDTPARWVSEYPAQLWAAVGLLAAGPILSLIVWVVARGRRTADMRRGLFTSAMVRSALVAALGVAIWLGALYAIELATMNGVLG